MQYAVTQHKLGMVLVGDCGVGKTFVSKVLMQQFFDGHCKFVYIANPRLTDIDFLHEIKFQLEDNIPPALAVTKPEFLHAIQARLRFFKEQAKHVVIIIDEAQSIPDDSLMEEIRLLLNLHEDMAVNFTMILSGQHGLLPKLNANVALSQRLSLRYELLGLDLEETIKYIEHRLEVTGVKRHIFTMDAYQRIHELSAGKPRLINNICDLALLTGYMKAAQTIDVDIISHVLKELNGNAGAGDPND